MELASGTMKIAQIQSRHLYLFSLRRYVNEADIVTFPLRRWDPHKAEQNNECQQGKAHQAQQSTESIAKQAR